MMKKLFYCKFIFVYFFFTSLNTLNIAKESKPLIEWVDVPAGTFNMGSPKFEMYREDNETEHLVKLNAFKMSKYEITFEQYDRFCVATKRNKPIDNGWGRGKQPVINVSWDDATAFANWLGCRLPTEAEWEYACRSGKSTPFGTGEKLFTTQANYDGTYISNDKISGLNRKRTLPVGSFQPNAWGLFDMHGNVAEWCSDWYDNYPNATVNNPAGPNSGSYRVNRGGSWGDPVQYCRCAARRSIYQNFQNSCIGFRIVSAN